MRQRHEGGRGTAWRQRPSSEESPSVAGLSGWIAGRLPEGWFVAPPSVTVDREEILILGRVEAPDLPSREDGPEEDQSVRSAGEVGRITRFREETRDERMAIAREAEHLFGRSVAWGAEVGGSTMVFTNLSLPVMTRLRQPERRVLDTLVDSGVARSRSEALAWCVRLVGRNTDDWLRELRTAMETVEAVRQQGPAGS